MYFALETLEENSLSERIKGLVQIHHYRNSVEAKLLQTRFHILESNPRLYKGVGEMLIYGVAKYAHLQDARRFCGWLQDDSFYDKLGMVFRRKRPLPEYNFFIHSKFQLKKKHLPRFLARIERRYKMKKKLLSTGAFKVIKSLITKSISFLKSFKISFGLAWLY